MRKRHGSIHSIILFGLISSKISFQIFGYTMACVYIYISLYISFFELAQQPAIFRFSAQPCRRSHNWPQGSGPLSFSGVVYQPKNSHNRSSGFVSASKTLVLGSRRDIYILNPEYTFWRVETSIGNGIFISRCTVYHIQNSILYYEMQNSMGWCTTYQNTRMQRRHRWTCWIDF